jgi:hypothetical protein
MVPTIHHALGRFYPSLPLCTWIPQYHTFIAHAAPPLLEHHHTGGASPVELGNINRRLHQATTIKKQRQVMSRQPPQQQQQQQQQQRLHRDMHNNVITNHQRTDDNAMRMV